MADPSVPPVNGLPVVRPQRRATVDTIGTVATGASIGRAARLSARRQRRHEREAARSLATQRLLEDNEGAIIDNPLIHLSDRELRERVQDLFNRWGFAKYAIDIDLFHRAAQVAQRPKHYASLGLPAEEERVFRLQKDATFWDETHIRIPIALCCIAAVVQGWTQSSANAANLYYPADLGMLDPSGNFSNGSKWLFEVQNAALFLSGALAGCWLSDPLNEWIYGRRGAIFIAACFTLTAVLGQAFCKTKWELLVFRIILGLGMGAKASVVPIYAAEVSPARLRGRLVINWQVFTAFGIFVSFTVNLVCARTKAWRIMFGSGIVPTLCLLTMVFACPESPRFLLKRGLYIEAYRSYLRLRGSPIAAAEEMITLDAQLQAAEAQLMGKRKAQSDEELANRPVPLTPLPHGTQQEEYDDYDDYYSDDEDDATTNGKNTSTTEIYDGPRGFRQRITAWWSRMWIGNEDLKGDNVARDPFVLQFRDTNYIKRVAHLVIHKRVARASLAAAVVMIAQQLCGINILAFYSSSLFGGDSSADIHNGVNDLKPLWYSWGFGITNFLFSFPAYFLVDRKGRRWLLLWTFPFMAICLLITALVIEDHQNVAYAFIIVFTALYSFGGGPIPFAYSAEVYPLTNREAGMSFAVFWNFLGAGLLLLLVPRLLPSKSSPAASARTLLGIFTGLCMLAWVFIFLFVPETKEKTLEEINYIFGVPTLRHCRYQLLEVAPYKMDQLVWRWIFPRRERVKKPYPLYRWYDENRAGGNQPVG
ncbi:hypothetical protein BT63DRAFT_482841 [Microthyrium microscopicum]|uniref:Major facilitator superfamily (MFS) profile domain-containing protein n=1 Tax=Microthyrium microscopicum TaxID=703497 RepID=A0A6A6TXX5_9PEZI|nr:hypothetical protein BT63DRAFT_482841 [Microthyrium microscopicum]